MTEGHVGGEKLSDVVKLHIQTVSQDVKEYAPAEYLLEVTDAFHSRYASVPGSAEHASYIDKCGSG